MTLTSGTKLGPYEVVSPLGAGGMGEVYRAIDTRLDRTVAIKILPAHLSSNPEAKQRFEREARAISSLNHPNICTLYDVGHQDGTDYLVMEFLEGETLADRLVKGPLPLDQVLEYGIEISEGLEKAHTAGVTHRDLKPGNMMLTKTGAKLMDFGLAKSASPPGAPASALTLTGPGQPAVRLRRKAWSSEPFSTCRRSRSKGKKRMPGATFSPWARCCMRWRQASGRSRGRANQRHRCDSGTESSADFRSAADVSASAGQRG